MRHVLRLATSCVILAGLVQASRPAFAQETGVKAGINFSSPRFASGGVPMPYDGSVGLGASIFKTEPR